jgi:hypothetical protein
VTAKLRFPLVLSTLAGVLLFVSAGPASAAAPCWKTLINDWYDGRIDNIYPVACYQQALKHLPEDVQTYSSARDDIRAALASRLTPKRKGVLPTVAPGKGGSGPSSGSGTKGRDGGGGPVQEVAKKLGPKDATSFPIPLIVLAGIAGLLLAAGAAGFATRRIQARRVVVPPLQPDPPSEPQN